MRMISAALLTLAAQTGLFSQGRPEGYATRTANGAFSITGGGDGQVVKVASEADLEAALKRTEALVIQVTAPISGDNQFDVASNKTIVGMGDVKAGGAGHLKGVGFVVRNGAANVIFRNLIISHVKARNKDAITLDGAQHVWVDHCEFFSDVSQDKDYYDGLVDITHGSDFVTLSWNYFHDHWKASLVGHSDNNSAEDAGKLRVTYHHNHFKNVNSRLPSLRFGTGHVFNNLFDNTGAPADFDANTGISSRLGACVRAEFNRSLGLTSSVLTDQSGTGADAGKVQLIGNEFSGSIAMEPACQLTPPYAFSNLLQPVADAVAAVKADAGATLKEPLNFTAVPVSARPGIPQVEADLRLRRFAGGIYVQASASRRLRIEWYGPGGNRILGSETVDARPGWTALKNPPTASGTHVYALKGDAGEFQRGIVVLP